MRALIVADIHSNVVALQAVLDDCMRQGGFERIWCPGDIVGYGPDPQECMALLRQHSCTFAAGNHDLGAVNRADLSMFNDAAAEACAWTARHLESREAGFLAGLPEVTLEGDFTLVHGSLRSPIWEYLTDEEPARATFSVLCTRFCLVGHSHVPFICRETGRSCEFGLFTEGVPVRLGPQRAIVNPGSVGQPRDGDPRASYAVYDSEAMSVTLYRTAYDIVATQTKMRLVGLPESLAERLSFGH